MTAAAGLTRNFGQLFLVRLGVGVGEADLCARLRLAHRRPLPGAAAREGDVRLHDGPPDRRGAQLSGQQPGRGEVRLAAGVLRRGGPGAPVLGGGALPPRARRGGKEAHAVGSRKRDGSPYLLVLATPTMCWLILSGALHNFNMYALSAFQMPYLMRYHGATLADAGRLSTLLALAGIPGLLLGGFAGDSPAARTQRPAPRGALAILLSRR